MKPIWPQCFVGFKRFEGSKNLIIKYRKLNCGYIFKFQTIPLEGGLPILSRDTVVGSGKKIEETLPDKTSNFPLLIQPITHMVFHAQNTVPSLADQR